MLLKCYLIDISVVKIWIIVPLKINPKPINNIEVKTAVIATILLNFLASIKFYSPIKKPNVLQEQSPRPLGII